MTVLEINVLVLAYLGDTIYENYVRRFLINKNIANVNDLQKESLNYVSANSQRRIVEHLIINNLLTEEEMEIFKWGRNAHGGKSKSADIVTYRIATGLEALIGVLYSNNKKDRIDQIMEEVFKI